MQVELLPKLRGLGSVLVFDRRWNESLLQVASFLLFREMRTYRLCTCKVLIVTGEKSDILMFTHVPPLFTRAPPMFGRVPSMIGRVPFMFGDDCTRV